MQTSSLSPRRMRARFWCTALLLGSACRDGTSGIPAPSLAPNAGAAVAPSADLDQSSATIDILTYQYDLARTGVTSLETVLTPANVTAGSFGKTASFAVDGLVYAEPLYVSRLALPKGEREVLFVATEHDSVYAFDASGATSEPLWHVSLLATGELPVPAEDTLSDDLVPEVGITGTPVIDRAAELLYVVSKAKRTDGSYDATDLTKELYASPSSKLEANAAAPAVKFTVPAVANGRVFVGGQKAVTVYGLLH